MNPLSDRSLLFITWGGGGGGGAKGGCYENFGFVVMKFTRSHP